MIWRVQDYFLVLFAVSPCSAKKKRDEKEKCPAIKISTVSVLPPLALSHFKRDTKAHHKLSSANKHEIKKCRRAADPFIIGASRPWLVNKSRNWLIIIRGMERIRLRRTRRMITFIMKCTQKMPEKTLSSREERTQFEAFTVLYEKNVRRWNWYRHATRCS